MEIFVLHSFTNVYVTAIVNYWEDYFVPFRMYAYMYVCIHVCMHIYICMYVCMYVCIHVCMYVWMDGWMDVSVAEWLARLTSNCGRIGAIGSSPSNGLKPNL